MTEDHLGPSGRALLDAARPALGPDADAARRMRTKIAATVEGGAIAGIATRSALAAKLGVIGAIAALAIGATVYATRSPDPSDARVMIRHVAIAAPAVATPVTPGTPVEPIEPIEQEMPAIDVGSAKPTPAKHPVAVEIALAREVELVDHAMAAMKAHDPRGALASIRIYDIESRGHGQLAEDAAAIEVEAMCAVNDPGAANRLATFDQRFAHSAQRTRLAEACR